MSNNSAVVIVDTSDEEGEEEETVNGLTGDECEKRCQAFAEVTGTDSALAMFYLQDREWNVERALDAFFQSTSTSDNQAGGGHTLTSHTNTITTTTTTTHNTPAAERTSNLNTHMESTEEPSNEASASRLTIAPPLLQPRKEGTVRILSWNIDGLDPDNLQSRTHGACGVLKQENPEVIFLQEVVMRSLVIIQEALPNYEFFMGYGDKRSLPYGAYFTTIAVRKDCVVVESERIIEYPTTKMERNLLLVKCQIDSTPVSLMTSHLESTAEYSEERQRQLKIAFQHMSTERKERTVIFGGDLNLRDKELKGISKVPDGVYDIWECTGKRPNAKFTWDLSINDNKQLGGKFQPRCRFDRLFVSHPLQISQGEGQSERQNKVKVKLKPVYFELVGIQRLVSCQRFPSDHWGILSHFSRTDMD